MVAVRYIVLYTTVSVTRDAPCLEEDVTIGFIATLRVGNLSQPLFEGVEGFAGDSLELHAVQYMPWDLLCLGGCGGSASSDHHGAANLWW